MGAMNVVPLYQWDGHLGCAWDSLGFPQRVHYVPWYSGMGWTLEIWGVVHGTAWDSPSVSITHGTVGWDGMGWTILTHSTVGWDGIDIAGIPPVCPLLLSLWYSGMGWTFVRQLRISQEH